MTRHLPAALLAAAWVVPPVPAAPLMDIAPFGTLSSWGSGTEPLRLATASAGDRRDLGIEWRDERDVSEVRVRFAGAPPGNVTLQYWFQTWPSPPPQMPTIEDPADDRWQGRWLTAAISTQCRQSECWYTFEPLAAGENPLAGNLPGVRYRRTLKVRLASNANLPPVASLSVFTGSVEKPLSLRIALGYREKHPVQWAGAVEISNGRLRSVKPWDFGAGDSFESPRKWTFLSSGALKGLLLDLIAAAPSLPGSLDSTLLTVRASASGESRTFTFNIDDLERGPIYIPAFHAYVTDAAQPGGFRPAAGKGPSIRSQIPKEPEQTYERASREIPPLDPWQDQYGDRIYLPLAPDASWQKFAFEYGGNVFISKNGTKALGRERARLVWDGDRIAWRIGTGQVPYYRDDRKASLSLLDGYLPVVTQRWENDGLKYREEALRPCCAGRSHRMIPAGMSRLRPF